MRAGFGHRTVPAPGIGLHLLSRGQYILSPSATRAISNYVLIWAVGALTAAASG